MGVPMFQKIKSFFAKLLAKIFYHLVDPKTEAELAWPDEYDRVQEIRRQDVERFLTRYLGPKL